MTGEVEGLDPQPSQVEGRGRPDRGWSAARGYDAGDGRARSRKGPGRGAVRREQSWQTHPSNPSSVPNGRLGGGRRCPDPGPLPTVPGQPGGGGRPPRPGRRGGRRPAGARVCRVACGSRAAPRASGGRGGVTCEGGHAASQPVGDRLGCNQRRAGAHGHRPSVPEVEVTVPVTSGRRTSPGCAAHGRRPLPTAVQPGPAVQPVRRGPLSRGRPRLARGRRAPPTSTP